MLRVKACINPKSIAVNKTDYTHDMVLNSGLFNLSVISEEAKFELFRHFGFQSGRDTDKFEGYSDMKRSENGLYYVTSGTNAFLSGKVDTSHNFLHSL